MAPINCGIISGIIKMAIGVLKAVSKILVAVFKLFSVAIIYALIGVILFAVWQFNPFDGSLFAKLYLVGFGLSVLLSLILAYKLFKKNGNKKEVKNNTEEEKPLSWFEKRKRKKEQAIALQKEEDERIARLKREEDLREQERRLEELKAERLQAEIQREERLLETYRQEAANAALQGYNDVVRAHPIPPQNIAPQIEEPNYFGAPINTFESPVQPIYESIPQTRAVEEPDIYMSAVEDNILIHEYSDRFEVYRLNGGEKTLVKVEYKN